MCIFHCVCVFVPPQVDQVGLFVSKEVHKEFVLEFGIRDPHLSKVDENGRSKQGSTNSWILGSLCRGSGDGKRKWEERGGNFTTRTKNGVFALNSVYLQQEA